jgi:hypothetical protein
MDGNMHATTLAPSADGDAVHGALAFIADDESSRRRQSDNSYFSGLKAWRNDPAVWRSAMDFLTKALDGMNAEDLVFCAVHVHDAQHAAEFRAGMKRIARSLGLSMGHNVVFTDSSQCSTEAIWSMPVVIAERLAAEEGGWATLSSKPTRATPASHPGFVAVLVDGSGNTVNTPPWGWRRSKR